MDTARWFSLLCSLSALLKAVQRNGISFQTDQSLTSQSGSEGIPHLQSQQVLAENDLSPQAGIKLMVDGERLSYISHTSETITMAPGWTFA